MGTARRPAEWRSRTWAASTSATDIVVGIQYAGQNSFGRADLVGHCANTLPLRVSLDPQCLFSDFVRASRDALLEARVNNQSGYVHGGERLPQVSVSASRDETGKVHVSLCNLAPRASAWVEIVFAGQVMASEATLVSLRVYDVIEHFRGSAEFQVELYRPWNRYDLCVFQKFFDRRAWWKLERLRAAHPSLLYSTSGGGMNVETGRCMPTPSMVEACDFLLPHGNGTRPPQLAAAIQAIQAMEAGKHVYSAVPIISIPDGNEILEWCDKLIETCRRTGKHYMLGETTYYRPQAMYCRRRAREGAFGDFVYSEGEYYHDVDARTNLREVMRRRSTGQAGQQWLALREQYRARAQANPYAASGPMHYPTHSVSMILSVTGARATTVSCLGFEDHHSDGIFRVGANNWDNVFSNETALMRTSDGGMIRINEFRRIGHPGTVGMSMYGTEASYEEQAGAVVWVTRDRSACIDLSQALSCADRGMSQVHPVHLLPKAYEDLPSGHLGSHQFLIHDFVSACVSGEHPPNNVWQAARYLIPGLVAHESALAGGELVELPDLGMPSAEGRPA